MSRPGEFYISRFRETLDEQCREIARCYLNKARCQAGLLPVLKVGGGLMSTTVNAGKRDRIDTRYIQAGNSDKSRRFYCQLIAEAIDFEAAMQARESREQTPATRRSHCGWYRATSRDIGVWSSSEGNFLVLVCFVGSWQSVRLEKDSVTVLKQGVSRSLPLEDYRLFKSVEREKES